MTPLEAARRVRLPIIQLGAAYGNDPSFATRGAELGLGRWPFYFAGRAGVLGPVDAGVVAAACGFFAPPFVRSSWEAALATGPLEDFVQADTLDRRRGRRTHPARGSRRCCRSPCRRGRVA